MLAHLWASPPLARVNFYMYCRRYVPPPTFNESQTSMEPPPFADLFDGKEDIFADVSSTAGGRNMYVLLVWALHSRIRHITVAA